MTNEADLVEAVAGALRAGDPRAKIAAAQKAAQLAESEFAFARFADWPSPPSHPSRPARPELVPPGKVKRRRLGTREGRTALLHALAHIEFNAVDLAFDMALRFAPAVAREGLDGAAFFRDWAHVGGEEAGHFLLLCERLAAMGAAYGDLPAHGGLWEAAASTADDVLARLAVAPLVLEARGLDVTPAMIEKLEKAGDGESAAALRIIYRDEIGHVSSGVRWFVAISRRRGMEPKAAFARLVAERLAGGLKPPFNQAARSAAGLAPDFYAGAYRRRLE